MAATVYVALGTPNRQGEDAADLAVHLCAWAFNGSRKMWLFDVSPFDGSRVTVSEIAELVLDRLEQSGIDTAVMWMEAVNGCPEGMTDMSYRPLPQETFDGLNSYLTGR